MRRIILLSTCRIPTIALWRHFLPRPRRLFSKATYGRLPIWAVYPRAFFMTTPGWRWRGSWATGRAFSELQSHYLFAEKFGRPAKGNDKGKVEGLVGYVRRNFMVPIPRASSWEELNVHLEAACLKRRQRRLRGHRETIAERFERDP